MNLNPDREKLKQSVQKSIQRFEKARRERSSFFAQTIYLGSLGLMFVLPVIGGAYLGRWLDSRLSGYSISWTLSLIVLGVLVGAMSVILFLRER